MRQKRPQFRTRLNFKVCAKLGILKIDDQCNLLFLKSMQVLLFAADAHLCQILWGQAIQEEKFLHVSSFLKSLPEKQKQVDEFMFTVVGKYKRGAPQCHWENPTNKKINKEGKLAAWEVKFLVCLLLILMTGYSISKNLSLVVSCQEMNFEIKWRAFSWLWTN